MGTLSYRFWFLDLVIPVDHIILRCDERLPPLLDALKTALASSVVPNTFLSLPPPPQSFSFLFFPETGGFLSS